MAIRLEPATKARVAIVDRDRCRPDACGNYLCAAVCPVNRADKECITRNEDIKKAVISEELCIGCQICVVKCPFDAIQIINLPQPLKEAIHRFGVNAFRLHRLPVPRENAVLGLIGRNGIGKSTALKILAGQLVPNLGDYESEPSYAKVLEHFKGKELLDFFQPLAEKKTRVSFKPQHVDALPQTAQGKVRELLQKVDERSAFNETAKQLHLTKILDRDLSQLSGGELQRVAIAAAALKDASFYAFDEPSSYLDVRERLNMAKTLRGLAAEQRRVMVIEHDLAVVDYLSDYIHILYGAKAAYGIVSHPKTVRNGINEFLEGFIPDENMRFRDHALKFAPRPPASSQEREVKAVYPALNKTFDGFSLNVEAGELRKAEVVGILGPNGIGKTTFVKMLAGVEEPDSGSLDFSLKVSYKPQYLKAEPSVTVEDLFLQGKTDKDVFKTEVDRRLHVSKLFQHRVDSLSGGELQKVAVALALCQDADIYLLDEPSAFLDVEDRLNAADTIRGVVENRGKTALVVDHDILFQDYVSDRLIVFEGEQAVHGHALKPMDMHEGMNRFLKSLGITYRRDDATGRPRANKPGSQKDQEQKKAGEYYYALA